MRKRAQNRVGRPAVRNKQTALNLVGRYTWQEKQSMGIHKFLEMVVSSWPEGEPMAITRLQKPDGSHINGPSNAIEGYPSEDNQVMWNCTSQEMIMGGYSYSSGCAGYSSNHTLCHCDSSGTWSCQSHQVNESNC